MKSLRSFCYMQLKNRGGSIWIVALLILLSSWGAPGTFAQSSAKAARPSNKQLASPEIERKVDALLKKMTLEEKLGQLVQYSDSGYSGQAQTAEGWRILERTRRHRTRLTQWNWFRQASLVPC
jgi:hypothetical protein